MLACAMLFWSGNAVVGRAIRADVPPATLSLLRWSGALAILLPFAWAHLKRDRAALTARWGRVVVLGLLGVGSFNTLYYLGLHDTTASNGLLLQALIPAGVLIADRAIFGVTPARFQVLGVIVATLGVATIVFRADYHLLARVALGRGDVAILAAVVVWSVYTSLLRTKPDVHPLSFLAATFAVAVVALLPVSAIELAQGGTVAWNGRVALATVYVAIFPSLIAYLFFNMSVATIGPGAAGQATNLMPLFGALLAAAILGEPLHGYHVVGMAMILAGLAIGLAASRRSTA